MSKLEFEIESDIDTESQISLITNAMNENINPVEELKLRSEKITSLKQELTREKSQDTNDPQEQSKQAEKIKQLDANIKKLELEYIETKEEFDKPKIKEIPTYKIRQGETHEDIILNVLEKYTDKMSVLKHNLNTSERVSAIKNRIKKIRSGEDKSMSESAFIRSLMTNIMRTGGDVINPLKKLNEYYERYKNDRDRSTKTIDNFREKHGKMMTFFEKMNENKKITSYRDLKKIMERGGAYNENAEKSINKILENVDKALTKKK